LLHSGNCISNQKWKLPFGGIISVCFMKKVSNFRKNPRLTECKWKQTFPETETPTCSFHVWKIKLLKMLELKFSLKPIWICQSSEKFKNNLPFIKKNFFWISTFGETYDQYVQDTHCKISKNLPAVATCWVDS
jgi:hypothetical protein